MVTQAALQRRLALSPNVGGRKIAGSTMTDVLVRYSSLPQAVTPMAEESPSNEQFMAMEATDPSRLASWSRFYEETLEDCALKCQTLETEIEEAEKALKGRLFPVFVDHVKTKVLPSPGAHELFEKHPFVPTQPKYVAWGTPMAAAFVELALAQIQDHQQGDDNTNNGSTSHDQDFLRGHANEFWEQHGEVTSLVYTGWCMAYTAKIHRVVEAFVDGNIDIAREVFAIARVESRHTNSYSSRLRMTPLFSMLCSNLATAGKKETRGNMDVGSGERVQGLHTGQQVRFVLEVTRNYLAKSFPGIDLDSANGKNNNKPFEKSACLFVPIHEEDADEEKRGDIYYNEGIPGVTDHYYCKTDYLGTSELVLPNCFHNRDVEFSSVVPGRLLRAPILFSLQDMPMEESRNSGWARQAPVAIKDVSHASSKHRTAKEPSNTPAIKALFEAVRLVEGDPDETKDQRPAEVKQEEKGELGKGNLHARKLPSCKLAKRKRSMGTDDFFW